MSDNTPGQTSLPGQERGRCRPGCLDDTKPDPAHVSVQEEVAATMAEQGVPPVVHPPPFYGNPADVPERPPVIAGVQFRVPSTALGDLRPFMAGRMASGLPAMDTLKGRLVKMGHGSSTRGEYRAGPLRCTSKQSANHAAHAWLIDGCLLG